MKIAVIGGNLLGCATTLNLSLVQEHDERVFQSSPSFSVTLLERSTSLGGHGFKSVPIDDSLRIEVGRYRTLPLPPGTFLSDLLSAANDGRGTVSLFGKTFAIPGATVSRRGKLGAAKTERPWAQGSYGRVIRTFAAWDWKADAYHMQHAGWPLLDVLYRLLDNGIWRSVVLVALVSSARRLSETEGVLARALMLAQCVTLFALFVFSPKRCVAAWQRTYTFWGSTLPMLLKYGITPAISRGSTIGFVKLLNDLNTKNVATCSLSAGSLVARAGLEPHVRGSGEDCTRIFKYNREFVHRFIAPVVGWEYAGAKLSEISSLASHFATLDGDFSNSDVAERFQQVRPDNASLCTALIDAAKATMPVDVKLGCAVTEILFDEESRKYKIVYESGESHMFDGVALCASPKDGEIVITTPLGMSISELFGYDKDAEAAEGHAAQEAVYIASQGGEGEEEEEATVSAVASSYCAVVIGKANPAFFRFNVEKRIPDLVQMTFAPGVSRFERIREASDEQPGVYTVLCGEDFESAGIFAEMFEEGAELKYFEAMPKSAYTHNPVPANKDVDECMPHVVLGSRFIYAAATDKLAKHPEMDAISAVNAASLFSKAVQWTSGDESAEREEEGDAAKDT